MWEKLFYFDLSNIKVVEKKFVFQKQVEFVEVVEVLFEVYEINVFVLFVKVVEIQKKIKEILGVFFFLLMFISCVVDVVNDDLFLFVRVFIFSEFFDQVLGFDKVKVVKGLRGIYLF